MPKCSPRRWHVLARLRRQDPRHIGPSRPGQPNPHTLKASWRDAEARRKAAAQMSAVRKTRRICSLGQSGPLGETPKGFLKPEPPHIGSKRQTMHLREPVQEAPLGQSKYLRCIARAQWLVQLCAEPFSQCLFASSCQKWIVGIVCFCVNPLLQASFQLLHLDGIQLANVSACNRTPATRNRHRWIEEQQPNRFGGLHAVRRTGVHHVAHASYLVVSSTQLKSSGR